MGEKPMLGMKFFSTIILTMLISINSFASDDVIALAFAKFSEHYEARLPYTKEGSMPFILLQSDKAPTVVLIHGLSDSPGSMKEIAKVYYKKGFNVLSVLLRDHGLNEEKRKDAREKIKLDDWREDIDQIMNIAFSLSDTDKVSLAGYSLGGALATDTAHRYAGKIESMVLLTPLFKMNHEWAAPLTKYLKHFMYSTKKGIPETKHFYPDIALNQSYQAYKLTRYLKNEVTKSPSEDLLNVKKMMFLTDADTTIDNTFAIESAKNLGMDDSSIITYSNTDSNLIVLHRDLPMRSININSKENPHIDNLLLKLENFINNL